MASPPLPTDWTTIVTSLATAANAILVLALVWVTKRYVDETTSIARATRTAAEAAERSAAASERQILLSVRPQLIVPAALNFDCLNERSIKGPGGRDVLAPNRLTFQLNNYGAGHAFGVQPSVEVEGVPFVVGGFRPEGALLRNDMAMVTAQADATAIDHLFGRTHLSGIIKISFRDVTGARWLQEWPFQSDQDVTSAILSEPRLTRREDS